MQPPARLGSRQPCPSLRRSAAAIEEYMRLAEVNRSLHGPHHSDRTADNRKQNQPRTFEFTPSMQPRSSCGIRTPCPSLRRSDADIERYMRLAGLRSQESLHGPHDNDSAARTNIIRAKSNHACTREPASPSARHAHHCDDRMQRSKDTCVWRGFALRSYSTAHTTVTALH